MGSMGQPHPLTREIVPVSPADTGPLRTPDDGTSGPRPDDAGDADDIRSTGVIALEDVAGLRAPPRPPPRPLRAPPPLPPPRGAPARRGRAQAPAPPAPP